MNESTGHRETEKERRLREGLLSEADATRPEFSDPLHQRTMAAIRARSVERDQKPRDLVAKSVAETRRAVDQAAIVTTRWSTTKKMRGGTRGTWSLAAVVALAVSLMLWAGLPRDESADSERRADQTPGGAESIGARPGAPADDPSRNIAQGNAAADQLRLALSPPVGEELAALVDASITRPQWAYLDHDARLATDLVLSQIPFELTDAMAALDKTSDGSQEP